MDHEFSTGGQNQAGISPVVSTWVDDEDRLGPDCFSGDSFAVLPLHRASLEGHMEISRSFWRVGPL